MPDTTSLPSHSLSSLQPFSRSYCKYEKDKNILLKIIRNSTSKQVHQKLINNFEMSTLNIKIYIQADSITLLLVKLRN